MCRCPEATHGSVCVGVDSCLHSPRCRMYPGGGGGGGGGGGCNGCVCVPARVRVRGCGSYGVGRTVPPWVRPVLGLGRELGVGARLISCPCHCWD